jgi:hypothetical protein
LQHDYVNEYQTDGHPEDHHIPPLTKRVGRLRLDVELHRRLFTLNSPDTKKITFEPLYERSIQFTLKSGSNMVKAKTLGHMDMLYHVFQHSLHVPLGNEGFRLINIADVMGIVSCFSDKLDWDRIQGRWPNIYRALPYLDYLCPWPHPIQDKLGLQKQPVPRQIGEKYTGWPCHPRGRFRREKICSILKQTFCPPEWWLMIYYTPPAKCTVYWYLFIVHPLNVLKSTLKKVNIHLDRGRLVHKIKEFI